MCRLLSISHILTFLLKLVSKMRLELTQPTGHYPLKVARLPIPPPGLVDKAYYLSLCKIIKFMLFIQINDLSGFCQFFNHL